MPRAAHCLPRRGTMEYLRHRGIVDPWRVWRAGSIPRFGSARAIFRSNRELVADYRQRVADKDPAILKKAMPLAGVPVWYVVAPEQHQRSTFSALSAERASGKKLMWLRLLRIRTTPLARITYVSEVFLYPPEADRSYVRPLPHLHPDSGTPRCSAGQLDVSRTRETEQHRVR